MKAYVGYRLWPEGDESRAGLIIGVPNKDGEPPYVVQWRDGHIALAFPGPYTRIVPGGTEQVPEPGRPVISPS